VRAAGDQPRDGACESCLRHGWLLGALSAALDCRCRDRARLPELLALQDAELVAAVGGRRRQELEILLRRFRAEDLEWAPAGYRICHHDPRYPAALSGSAAPRMLFLSADPTRLQELTAAPVAAIVGSRRASDYGIETARGLSRGLAASGVTILAGLADGIAAATHSSAIDAGGATIAVMAGGLEVSGPARLGGLERSIRASGCAVAELPDRISGRRWGRLAGERIVAELAALTVVVEAEDTPGDLHEAVLARSRGRALAAVPGRISSPLTAGTHRLLREGATLVRDAEDVLEVLCRVGTARTTAGPRRAGTAAAGLDPHLREVLHRVGAGSDTPDRLIRDGIEEGDALLALGRLELMGLLVRGAGGRYLPGGTGPPS